MSTSSTEADASRARAEEHRREFIKDYLAGPTPAAVRVIADAILKEHPGSAILLYGSGNSLLKAAKIDDVLFDFYVIARSYAQTYRSSLLRLANLVLPPNVFYIECASPAGRLRAKYAVLSIGHFERLVSQRTFHSYFWGRFAQPCRIVCAPDDLRARVEGCIAAAVDTFTANSSNLMGAADGVDALWRVGLAHSYKSELRAEPPERVARLLRDYGDWPSRVTIPPLQSGRSRRPSRGADSAQFAWKLRAVQGGALSAARLLKGALTFKGGVDYIAWKISRHAGFTLPVRDWERRWPILAAPVLAHRYYSMRREHAARMRVG